MQVNGSDFDLSLLEGTNLHALISYFKLKPDMVAVERNGKIEEKNSWNSVVLEATDSIELIKFIGGG